MISVKFKNGSVREYDNGTTIADVAKSLGGGIYKNACAGKVNGELKDLRTELEPDGCCELEILTFDDKDGKKTFWHTASHILAQAVKRLYPQAKIAIGPAIDNGFYYDFDVEKSFSTELIAFEIGYDIFDGVTEIMKRHDIQHIRAVKDFGGIDRCVFGTVVS